MRFLGIKNDIICVVSDSAFLNSEFNSLELPKEFSNLSNKEIIENLFIRNNKIYNRKTFLDLSNSKVAVISNFRMRCGISTYFENLFPHFLKNCKDFKLFIEKNDIKTGDIFKLGELSLSTKNVSECWKRGESTLDLIKSINDYNPDVIVINHEWGLFPNAKIWLSLLTQLSKYKIVVIQHSVYPKHLDKTICEAAMPNIIVHLDGAKSALIDKGISADKINVLQHGCYPIVSKNQLWNFYNTKNRFIQSGFGFKYKNFEDSIRATHLLKNKYPDIFFTALISESPYNRVGHQQYFDELFKLIQDFNLEENVGIVRGFQEDSVIDSYLRTNKVAVFPYKMDSENVCFGSSGAARQAMSKHLPVITSSIHHFSDLPTIKANTPEQLASAIDTIFSNEDAVIKQLQIQEDFINKNNWENISNQLVSIIERVS